MVVHNRRLRQLVVFMAGAIVEKTDELPTGPHYMSRFARYP